ncbi:MAG: hypothetical protein CMM93_08320 [Rickettsiales bacterium]|nr:hypothetical protein [Rickettsiales bacterium]|tara:strand:+ start:141 stop:902 length:762 start_codon:yes stop_codon:yes gene_type:complete
MKRAPIKPISGFSLVELSIVLVILGLLTGGILTGQSLIRAAELRSVATEFQKYQTALHSFREKYFALPGDMKNATAFWGSVSASGGNCLNDSGSGTDTCDGNGDGYINYTQESRRFWQHLSHSGLIEGNYAGVAISSSPTGRVPGANIPASKLSNGSWYATNNITQSYSIDDKNVYVFANFYGEYNDQEVLTPEEAWGIDKKLDDGKPGMGRIMSRIASDSQTPNCSTTDTAATAEYTLADKNIRCTLHFLSF